MKASTKERFDLIIAGAGPAGAALACALTPWLRRIAIVDAHAPVGTTGGMADQRVLALADHSVRILAGLGIWREIAGRATPIRQVTIAGGASGPRADLDGRRRATGVLGYTLPAAELIAALHARLLHRSVTWFAPAAVETVTAGDNAVTVGAGGAALSARLLVGADGTRSRIREELGIVTREHDYAAQALVTTVHSEPPPSDIAYELLTPGGPLALLPLRDRWAIVWVQPQAVANDLLALSDGEFLARLQTHLGSDLRLTTPIGLRSAHSLRRLGAWTLTGERTALIGNAAHTVHPVGAQGFNLGLRDAATLAECVANAVRCGVDPGDPVLLDTYARRREPDHRRVLAFTDGLARLLGELTPARRPWFGLGLDVLRHFPPLRAALTHLGTGGLDTPTRLGRGLPL